MRARGIERSGGQVVRRCVRSCVDGACRRAFPRAFSASICTKIGVMNESASSLRRLDEDAVRIVPVEREVEWARVRNPSDTGLFFRVEIVHNSVILASEGDFFAQDASGT